MRKKSRLISIFMLFVLATLSLKVLFAGTFGEGSCDEFGHIHFRDLSKVHASVNSKSNSSAQALNTLNKHTDHKDSDESCHEGKSIFAYVVTPQVVINEGPKYAVVFNVILSLENHFKSPYLEPHRKPPKLA